MVWSACIDYTWCEVYLQAVWEVVSFTSDELNQLRSLIEHIVSYCLRPSGPAWALRQGLRVQLG